jgi:hypothetical protein
MRGVFGIWPDLAFGTKRSQKIGAKRDRGATRFGNKALTGSADMPTARRARMDAFGLG